MDGRKVNLDQLIEVPDYVKDVCASWHDGQASSLYSVASTGKLKLRNAMQVYNDLPRRSDPIQEDYDTEDTFLKDKIAIVNANAWVGSLLTDEWHDAMDADSLIEEEIWSMR